MSLPLFVRAGLVPLRYALLAAFTVLPAFVFRTLTPASAPQGGSPLTTGDPDDDVSNLRPRFEAPPLPPLAAPVVEGGCGRSEDVPDVNLHSGELRLAAVDLRIPGVGLDFVWGRTYRSRLGSETGLGFGWCASYEVAVRLEGAHVRLDDGSGRFDLYRRQPNGTYVAREFFREGVLDVANVFTLTFPDGGRWSFRPTNAAIAPGRLASIADRNGNTQQFAYDAQGRLAQVIDTLGRTIQIGWSGNRLVTVTDFAGRVVRYAYYQAGDTGGSPGDLKSVTSPSVTGTPNGNDFPIGKTTVFTYSRGFADARQNHNLLTITDPRGNTWMTNVYAATNDPLSVDFDRLVRQTRGGASDTIELVYEPLPVRRKPGTGPDLPVLLAIVNDRVGNVSHYAFDVRGRRLSKEVFAGRATNGAPTTSTANRPGLPVRSTDPEAWVTRYEYDADSLVTRIVHPDGNVTRKVYEAELVPSASARTRGNLRELREEPGTHPLPGDQPAGTIERFEYAAGQGGCCGTNFVSRHTDARGHVTEHAYDAFGNRLETRHRIASIVENWTWDARGRLLSHTFPADANGYRRRDEFSYHVAGCQAGYLAEHWKDADTLALLTTTTWDCVGNRTSATDPLGHEQRWTYNALNQVVVEFSPLIDSIVPFRYEKRFVYDANDNLVQVDVQTLDELGNVDPANPWITTTHEYGVLNELLATVEEVAAGDTLRTEYAYDGNRNRTLVRTGEATNGNQPANVIAQAFDTRDLLLQSVRGTGAVRSTDHFTYDGNRHLVRNWTGVESGPHETTRVYDALGRLRTETDAMGNVTERHYDPNGNPGGLLGGDGSTPNVFARSVQGEIPDLPGSANNDRLHEEQYQYDAMDRRVRHDVRYFDPMTQIAVGDGNSTTTWTLDGLGDVLTVSDDLGHVTSYEWDTLRRLHVATDAKGNTTTRSYDGDGNVLTEVEIELPDLSGPSQAFTTTYAYDALDRLVTRTRNGGLVESFAYDARGNRVVETDPNGRKTRYVYDALDRLVRTERDVDGNGATGDPGDAITQLQWDENSRPKARTDDGGGTTRYAYDALDRLIVTQHADGTLEQNGSGATWTLGQPAPDLGGFTPGWDAHDRKTRSTDPNGTQVTYTYDALDRVVSKSVVRAAGVLGTTTEAYEYDGLARIVTATDDDSRVTRGYDSLGNRTRETEQVLPAGPVRTITQAFDAEGNATQLTYPGGRVIQRTFDALDRPVTVIDPADAGPAIATYSYVGRDRVQQRVNGNGTVALFGYDGIVGVPNPAGDFGWKQLIRTEHVLAIPAGTRAEDRRYLHDRNGNRTQDQTVLPTTVTRAYSYDGIDRLVSSTGPASVQYALNGSGDRTSVAGTVDPGTYAVNAVHEYLSTPFDARTYDANGNVRTLTNPARTLSYDYVNRLVQVVNGAQTHTYSYDCFGRRIERNLAGARTRHYWCGAFEVEEQNAADATAATFVDSGGRHTRLQMKRGSNVYYLHHDDLGSVRRVTDGFGALVESVDYGDFGLPTTTLAPASTTTRSQAVLAPRVTVASDTTPSPTTGQTELRADDFTVPDATKLTSVQWFGSYQPGTSTTTDNYDQGTNFYVRHSDIATGPFGYVQTYADDFTLPQAWTVSSLSWRGAYDYDPNQPPPASDFFSITLFYDAAGVPGGTAYSFTTSSPNRQSLYPNTVNGNWSGLTEYAYSVNLPVPFQAQAGVRYWLRIMANTSTWPVGNATGGSWGWETGSIGNFQCAYTISGYPGWNGSGEDLSFVLGLTSTVNETVPPAVPDNFVIELRADAGGVPSSATPLRTYGVGSSATRTATAVTTTVPGGTTQPLYSYTYAIPGATQHALAPNTRYWLTITNLTASYGGIWAWSTGTGGNATRAVRTNGGAWTAVSGDQATTLTFALGGVASGNPYLFRGMRYDAETGFLLDGSRNVDARAGRYAQALRDDWLSADCDLGNPYTFVCNAPVSMQDKPKGLPVFPYGQDPEAEGFPDEETLKKKLEEALKRTKEARRGEKQRITDLGLEPGRCGGGCGAIIDIELWSKKNETFDGHRNRIALRTKLLALAKKVEKALEAKAQAEGDLQCLISSSDPSCTCKGVKTSFSSPNDHTRRTETVTTPIKGLGVAPVMRVDTYDVLYIRYTLTGTCSR